MLMADITEPAMRWLRFITEELAIDNPPVDLALLMYNKEYESIEAFLENLPGGPTINELNMSGFYIYDYIYENIEEYLSDDIDKIVGKSGAIMSDVKVIEGVRKGDFIAYGYFRE